MGGLGCWNLPLHCHVDHLVHVLSLQNLESGEFPSAWSREWLSLLHSLFDGSLLGYCLQAVCISCVFSRCFVILGTLRDHHHLWHNMLTICSTTRQSPGEPHHSWRYLTRIMSVTRHVMSFLHGSDFTILAFNNASFATPRHARRCLFLRNLHVSEHRIRAQLESLKQHIVTTMILTSQVSGTHIAFSLE